MLSIYVYHHDTKRGETFLHRCMYIIRKNQYSILDGGIYSERNSFDRLVEGIDSSSLFMVGCGSDLEPIAEEINNSEANSYMVVVLESFDDMYSSVKPSVRPAGILLENSDDFFMGRVIGEIYSDYMRYVANEEGPEYRFRIKGDDYVEYFKNIYLIEVQSKKITFHTESQAYEFYDSLDAVMKAAPDNFVRIHRSYVVNLDFIKSISFRDKVITLSDDSEVFFSRNYSSALREQYMRNLQERSST